MYWYTTYLRMNGRFINPANLRLTARTPEFIPHGTNKVRRSWLKLQNICFRTSFLYIKDKWLTAVIFCGFTMIYNADIFSMPTCRYSDSEHKAWMALKISTEYSQEDLRKSPSCSLNNSLVHRKAEHLSISFVLLDKKDKIPKAFLECSNPINWIRFTFNSSRYKDMHAFNAGYNLVINDGRTLKLI